MIYLKPHGRDPEFATAVNVLAAAKERSERTESELKSGVSQLAEMDADVLAAKAAEDTEFEARAEAKAEGKKRKDKPLPDIAALKADLEVQRRLVARLEVKVSEAKTAYIEANGSVPKIRKRLAKRFCTVAGFGVGDRFGKIGSDSSGEGVGTAYLPFDANMTLGELLALSQAWTMATRAPQPLPDFLHHFVKSPSRDQIDTAHKAARLAIGLDDGGPNG